MRKSIYYVIINALSAIGAFIFTCCMNSSITHIYPYFGFNLVVTSNATAFEPFKYILVVIAASLVFMFQDLMSASKNGGKVPGDKVKGIIGDVITAITVLYTWVSVLLTFENSYTVGATINLPFWFIGAFVVCLGLIYGSKAIAKVNDNFSAIMVLDTLFVFASGILCQIFFADYWWIVIPTIGTSVFILLIGYILFGIILKKKN